MQRVEVGHTVDPKHHPSITKRLSGFFKVASTIHGTGWSSCSALGDQADLLSLQPEPLDVVLHLIEASRHCPRRQWLWRECKNSNVLGIAGTNHWNSLQMGSPSDNCESKTPHLASKTQSSLGLMA